MLQTCTERGLEPSSLNTSHHHRTLLSFQPLHYLTAASVLNLQRKTHTHTQNECGLAWHLSGLNELLGMKTQNHFREWSSGGLKVQIWGIAERRSVSKCCAFFNFSCLQLNVCKLLWMNKYNSENQTSILNIDYSSSSSHVHTSFIWWGHSAAIRGPHLLLWPGVYLWCGPRFKSET